MKCTPVRLGATTAIVCGPKRPPLCRCGRPGEFLCDWKTGPGKTCDAPICGGCAKEVAPEKHLCPTHQGTYRARLERHPPRDGAGAPR